MSVRWGAERSMTTTGWPREHDQRGFESLGKQHAEKDQHETAQHARRPKKGDRVGALERDDSGAATLGFEAKVGVSPRSGHRPA